MLARDLPICTIFRRKQDNAPWIRVEPKSYLTMSKTIRENVEKGKPLVVNLVTGSLCFMLGSEEVKPVDSAKLTVEV
jgi:hypothetical protein